VGAFGSSPRRFRSFVIRRSTTHATTLMIVPRATRSNHRPNLPWGFR
jgi:hypothetical protein